jgi:hypothetical protein
MTIPPQPGSVRVVHSVVFSTGHDSREQEISLHQSELSNAASRDLGLMGVGPRVDVRRNRPIAAPFVANTLSLSHCPCLFLF